MTAPTIIGVAADGYTRSYPTTSGATTATRSFTVSIPNNATRMIMMFSVDTGNNSRYLGTPTLSGSNQTFTGDVTLLEYFNVSAPNSPVRATSLAIWDISKVSGSGTGNFEYTLLSTSSGNPQATSLETVLGVVCTDGFVESYVAGQERTFDLNKVRAFSENKDNNLTLYMLCQELSADNTSFSGADSSANLTTLFKGNSTSSTVSCCAATTTNPTRELTVTNTNSGADGCDVTFMISSQSDPFDGITGKLTSPITK